MIVAVQSAHAQEVLTTLPSISTTVDTGEKPQSKAWFHGHTWWTVLATDTPLPAGTWLCRLEPDGTWAFVLQLSSNSGTRADTKVVGDVTHVLMDNSTPSLVSLEYVAASNTYQLWSERPTPTPAYVGETGTIDVDSTGRMWLATESALNGVEVYYSDYPYGSFSGPIFLAPHIASDDITAVTALPNNTIGVFWTDRTTQGFGFRVHEDGTDPAVWLADEDPASQSKDPNGTGMSDDHVHLAVAPDGTLFAAVKTGHTPSGPFPIMALLVRHPIAGGSGGTWDDIHFVDNLGTRPIVVFNEDKSTIRVFYTRGTEIVFRESPASPIAFGPIQTLLPAGFNNATSAKDRWSGRLLVLASDLAGATGVLMTTDPGLVGYWKVNEGGGTQLRDMSGWGNNADVVGNPTWVPGVKGLALDLDGSDNAVVSDQAALDAATALTLSAWIQPVAETDQDLISRALTGSVDGYTLGLSSSSSPTHPRTAFLRFNQATSGELYQLNSLSQYPSGGYSWIHVAGTYDGTTMRMYVNGVEESSIVGPAAIAANAVDVGIGAQSDGTRRFNGTLDDIRIYNRALTSSEIASIAGSGPPEADLAITKDDFITSVTLGQSIAYTITATNFGPSAVTGATVSDVMPSQLADVTWTCSASAGASCGGVSGSGSINDLVNLAVGASVSYTVNATVSFDAIGTDMINTATIRASHMNDLVPGNNSSTDTDKLPFLVDAHFDVDADSFTYVDDLFRATSKPEYASGAQLASGGFTGGGLRVLVGGVNGSNIAKMSGGWQRSFSLAAATPVTLSFRYRLNLMNSRTDRFGQMLMSLDGVLHGVPPNDYVAQLVGTAPTVTTGWQMVQADLGTLPAGTHLLALGGYLSRKSQGTEVAEVLIDDVRVLSGAVPGPPVGPVPPGIATPPASVTVTEPASATFSVVATGDAPLSYQWRRNWVPIVGATGTSYVINPTSVAADNGALFDVVVSNAAGSVTSAAATLTVNPAPVPPIITTPPASVTVNAPAPASFSVVATSTVSLSYQWRRNGAPIGGATGASYVLTPTAGADSGASFDVVVTNVAGSVTSAAATLTVNVPPSITTPPANLTVTAPAAASFSVVAAGTAPLSYQWRRDGVPIGGATSASYVLDPTAVTDSGAHFDVVVTNMAGSATSAAATLTVSSGGSSSFIDAHFDTGADGFTYADDLFRGTTKPNYAQGAQLPAGGFSGGGLQVVVGGINSNNIPNMSGGWQRSFTLATATPVTLSFRYQLTASNLDSGELGQMVVSVNGVLQGVAPNDYVAQQGGTGVTMTTGWQQVQINLGTFPAGTHNLALGSYLTRKTGTVETAEVLIDDVVLTD